jgi:hypothetical protein
MEPHFISLRIAYRDGRFMAEEPAERKVMTLAELRALVCLAQANPREIAPHTLNFIQTSGELTGDVLVSISDSKTEALNA